MCLFYIYIFISLLYHIYQCTYIFIYSYFFLHIYIHTYVHILWTPNSETDPYQGSESNGWVNMSHLHRLGYPIFWYPTLEDAPSEQTNTYGMGRQYTHTKNRRGWCKYTVTELQITFPVTDIIYTYCNCNCNYFQTVVLLWLLWQLTTDLWGFDLGKTFGNSTLAGCANRKSWWIGLSWPPWLCVIRVACFTRSRSW